MELRFDVDDEGDDGMIGGEIGIPPGFSGDSLRAFSVSAPPPGFHGSHAERKQNAETLLEDYHGTTASSRASPWDRGSSINTTRNGGTSSSRNPFQVSHSSQSSSGGFNHGVLRFLDSDSDLYPEDNTPGPTGNKRSTSYTNLSRVLGESMAQSMEESLKSSLRKEDDVLQDLSTANQFERENRFAFNKGNSIQLNNGTHVSPTMSGFRPSSGMSNATISTQQQQRESELASEKSQSSWIFENNERSNSLDNVSPQDRHNFTTSMAEEEGGDTLAPDMVSLGRMRRASGKLSTSRQQFPFSSSSKVRSHRGEDYTTEDLDARILSFRSGSAPPELDFFTSGSAFNYNRATEGDSIFSAKKTSGHHSNLGPDTSAFTSSPHTISAIQEAPYPRSSATPPPSSESNSPGEDFGISSSVENLMRTTEKELEPYLSDTTPNGSSPYNSKTHPSRGLCIFATSGLSSMESISHTDIRSICESFGTLDTFRSDFWKTRRVLFLSYFDLRCAQRAAFGLQRSLMNLVADAVIFEVKYCIPLQASSPTDDSTILLSNLPPHVDENGLAGFMESYGGVRSVHFVATAGSNVEDDRTAYIVEFFDTQDAKHALLELESSEPFGDSVKVEIGMRNPNKRRQAKELLKLIGRWRMVDSGSSGTATTYNATTTQGGRVHQNGGGGSDVQASFRAEKLDLRSREAANHLSNSRQEFYSRESFGTGTLRRGSGGGYFSPTLVDPRSNEDSAGFTSKLASKSPSRTISRSTPPMEGSESTQEPSNLVENERAQGESQPSSLQMHSRHPQYQATQDGGASNNQGQYVPSLQATQVYVGQDGQCTYMMHPAHLAHGGNAVGAHAVYFDGQQHLQPGFTTFGGYAHPQNMHPHHLQGQQNQQPVLVDIRTGYPIHAPIYATCPHHNPRDGARGMNGKVPYAKRTGGGMQGKQGGTCDQDLALSIESVMSGEDTRTSLMVRNIPNKYTQKMLLKEFAQNGHGPDKMDFFYLPIDFKNKCNRGYAFVNFVEYEDIVPFYNKYNGQSWKMFNSDKICDITYARIQGKAAMLKRFEHSALLDKEDEYRPLVFVSSGPNKGQPEQFSGAQQSDYDLKSDPES